MPHGALHRKEEVRLAQRVIVIRSSSRRNSASARHGIEIICEGWSRGRFLLGSQPSLEYSGVGVILVGVYTWYVYIQDVWTEKYPK